MARIINFEGRQISVPDDATDDEVRAIIEASPPPAAAAATPAASVGTGGDALDRLYTKETGQTVKPVDYAEPTLTDRIMSGVDYTANTVGIAAREARRGAANIAGLPVDVVNNAPVLMNMVPGQSGWGPIVKEPVGGSQWNDKALGLFGLLGEPPPPQDRFQAAVGRVGQEVGAMAVPVAGVFGNIAGKAAASEVGPIARFFGADKAMVNPGKFVADEAKMAVAAGTGAAGANAATDAMGWGKNSTGAQLGDAAGAIAGAGAAGVGGAITRGGYDLIRAIMGRPGYTDEVVKEAVVDTIIRNSGLATKTGEVVDTQPLVDTIMRNSGASQAVPGFQPSLADVTKNPGIAALEYGRQSGPNAGMYTQRRAENTAAVDSAMSPLAPTEQPGAFRTALEGESNARIAAGAANVNDARMSFEDALGKVRPNSPNETARGSDIRAALEDASKKASDYERSVWEAASTSDPVEYNPLADAFKAVDKRLTDVERMKYRPPEAGIPGQRVSADTPEAPEGTPEGTPPPPVLVSAKEVTSLRSSLTTEIRKATSGLEPDENRARVLQKYVDAIDAYMDATPSLAGRFDEARAVSRDINDRFNRAQTGIAQTLSKNGGVYQADPSTVPGKFVQPDSGRVTDYRALMREAGADPRARKAVEDQIIADARSAGVADDPARLQQFLDERKVMLADFPDLKANLQKLGAARSAFDQASAQQTSLLDQIGKEGRGTVSRYLQYGDEAADRAMKAVIASKDPAKSIDELLTFVGDDTKAVEGARKVFWDIMEQKSRSGGRTTMDVNGAQPWSPYSLNQFLKDPVNSAILDRLYRNNPEHLTNIKQIAEAIQGTDLRNTAKAPNSSGTAQGVNNVLTPETIQSRLYAYKSGKISGSFLVTSILAVVARRAMAKAQNEGIQRMLDEALLDPKAAALLLQKNNPKTRAALARSANAWFGNEASTIINALSGEDTDEEKDAIMGSGK